MSNESSTLKRAGSISRRLQKLPYEKRVCRVEQYPSCLSPDPTYTGLSVEEYADFIHDVGVEVQIVTEVERGYARFPSRMLPAHPHVDQERLPRFLELAHEKDIIVLCYYAMIFNKPLKAVHPEWLMEFIDCGRPPPENQGWFCFNSPHRDWLPDYLIEWMDNLDLDGFYFDDTNWGSHAGRPFYPSCICSYCEELFRRDCGRPIPRKVDFDDPDFRLFVNWRYRKFLDFVLHLGGRMREKYPHVILDHHYYARPTTDWVDGHQLNPLPFGASGDHFFIEAHRSVRETGFIARVARALGPPFCVWRNQIQELPQCTSSYAPFQEPYSPLLHGLEALINGGSSIYGSFGGPAELHRDTMKTVFAELKKRVPYMEGETLKYAALHYSQQSRDFRPSEMAKNTGQEDYAAISQGNVNGTYEILNRSHLLVDVVLDDQLTPEHLSAYRVLFLADSCLSAAQCDAVRQFVEAGGTLLATHETSLLDDFGRRRDNFALADVLGVDYRGPGGSGDLEGVVYVVQDQDLARRFGRVICFPGCQAEVALRPGNHAQVLCTRSSLGGRTPLDDFDPRLNYDSGDPAATLNHYGRGRAIYLSSDVGRGYLENPYPPLRRFVDHLVRRTRPPLEIEAPQAIEVAALRRGANRLLIHLLNNPTPMLPPQPGAEKDVTTFFYLQELDPVRDVRVRFNDLKVQSAYLPLQDLELEVEGEPAAVVVPRVEVHEVLVVDVLD